MPNAAKRWRAGVVRYVDSGEARRVLFFVRVEGWAWRRRWVRCVQRWAGIWGGVLEGSVVGWTLNQKYECHYSLKIAKYPPFVISMLLLRAR
jgi:hypothetical protein